MLRAHQEGPQRLGDLRRQIDWAAEATIRGALSCLRDLGALEKRRAEQARNAVATALTPAGEDMLIVSRVLEEWLARSPHGPIAIGDGHVTVAVKALAEGWSSTLMRALATTPLTLTELSELISDISYPSLERRIAWMRTVGMLSPLPREPRGTPYEPTDWLRRAIAPLCVAGRCERRHLEDAPPITDVEVEAAFLMALPLVGLPQTARGGCLLASRTDPAEDEDEGDDETALAGVAVEVAAGEIVSITVELQAEPATWAIGTSAVWLDATIDGRIESLRIGGRNPQLGLDLAQGLHLALFGG